MQIFRKNGATSNTFRVTLRNSTTGQGLTGLTSASSGLIVSTICDNEATATAYTAAGSTIETITTLGTFAAPTATKCRFKEVDSTNHPGLYEIQLADARFAVTSAKVLRVTISGAANLLAKDVVIQLTTADLADTANIAANVAQFGGTSGTFSGGRPEVNTTHAAGTAWNSGAITASTIAADAITSTGLAASAVTEIWAGSTAPSAATIAAAVWDESLSGHVTSGTAGFAQNLFLDWNSAWDGINAVWNVNVSRFAGSTAASGVRTAIGLASANLDTQLGDLPTNSELATAITVGLTTALTEGYRGTGATGSVRDLLYEIIAHMGEATIVSTTKTLKKIDGSTTAKTYTLNDPNTPTSITETT